jgi:ABC-type multidrug transport system ATPase subunit
LIHSPRVVFFDEPFSGLDVALQKFIWDLLKDLSKQGKIVIISSHMLGDIQKNCNRIGLVEGGHYYNTKQIVQSIMKGKSLEDSLEQIFEKEIKL